ncbi:MAG: hypothetical protein ACO3IN_03815, partial [Steroidobacteraceae bacterium]
SNRAAVMVAALVLLGGCGGVRVVPQTDLPEPLLAQETAIVGVHYSEEFLGDIHNEERYDVNYEIELGLAHIAKLDRLFAAMFRQVIRIDDPLSGDPRVQFILVPRFEDYAFLTPRDLAGESYIVTIRYRIDVYSSEGQRIDGYVLTGYGREKSGAVSGAQPMKRATERAMRDAAAKVATELLTQDTVKALLGRSVEAQLPVTSDPAPPAASDAGSTTDSGPDASDGG